MNEVWRGGGCVTGGADSGDDDVRIEGVLASAVVEATGQGIPADRIERDRIRPPAESDSTLNEINVACRNPRTSAVGDHGIDPLTGAGDHGIDPR